MIRFLKDWTLPVAMLIGIIGFPVLSHLSVILPAMIFVMLLLTFLKVRVHDMKPRRVHLWLLLIELGAAPVAYWLLRDVNELLAEAIMVCIICPTATSAAVITQKLGGSAERVSTYTILANVGVAILVPILFPLIEPHPEVTFWSACLMILAKVFVLLICPLLLAILIRQYLPKAYQLISRVPDLAFYLWGASLSIVTAQIVRSFVVNPMPLSDTLLMGAAIFVVCVLQFFLGKTIGSVYNDRISAGQSLGQKNTILAIWMAHTYLNPLSAVGPGFYVLWQNVVNSWQLWKKRRRDLSV